MKMYSSMQDYDNRYTNNVHHSPGAFPASGFPIATTPPPPPAFVPYMNMINRGSGVRGNMVAKQWSTKLCHCCDDPANCVITLFCPCITFGQIADIVDKGGCVSGTNCRCCGCGAKGTIYGLLVMTGFVCLYSCFFRSKLRGQYDLVEAPCADCLVHFFCEPCALCQEYRELKNRGFDMGIGWKANMDRQQRAGAMVAPVAGHGGMTR